MTNDIEAAARAAAYDAWARHHYEEPVDPMSAYVDGWLACTRSALAHATRGEGEAIRYVVGQINGDWCVVDSVASEVVERFDTYDAAYAKSIELRITPPPATGEPDHRGEDREAVEAARRDVKRGEAS